MIVKFRQKTKQSATINGKLYNFAQVVELSEDTLGHTLKFEMHKDV